MPLWHVDYFELKVTKTLQAQKKLLLLLPLLNYPEEFKLGYLPIKRVITRNNFYGLSKNILITEHLLSLSFCNDLPPPL